MRIKIRQRPSSVGTVWTQVSLLLLGAECSAALSRKDSVLCVFLSLAGPAVPRSDLGDHWDPGGAYTSATADHQANSQNLLTHYLLQKLWFP